MKTTIKIGLTLSLLIGTSLTFAGKDDESKSPLGCRDQGYTFKLNVLDILPDIGGDNQSLYFVYNRLNQPIHLYQMLGNESTRSMYLNHDIRPQQWSALATNQKQLHFICAIDDPKFRYGKIVDCGDSVKVCEYARVKFGLNNRGNYWFLSSNTRGGAVHDVLRDGIIPR